MTTPKNRDPNNPSPEEIAEIEERRRIEDEDRAERLYQEQQDGTKLRHRGPKVYRLTPPPGEDES